MKVASWSATVVHTLGGEIAGGIGADQATGACGSKADRPHAALRTSPPTPGLFDHVPQALRRDEAGARRVVTTPGGSRSTSRRAAARPAQGEGFVMVELLFLPSVYAPCPTCHGARYNAQTLEVRVSRAKRSPRCWR